MERNDLLYTSKIFFNAAIPLLKVVVNDDERIKSSFAGSNAVIQIMARDSDGDQGTYLQFKDGEPTMGRGIAATWDICLEFSSLSKFVAFFTGNMLALPKIHGFRRPILLAKALGLLIKLTALQAVDAPKSEADRERLVKLLMYLLPAGISQLNKAGHPEVAKWAGKSPDRVYALAIDGRPEFSSYLRVKAGKSRSARGEYLRSRPFFTLKFDSVESALGIFLNKLDMIQASMDGKIVMEGGPEYGKDLGKLMLLVGDYAR
jgi:hypothetical protein